MTGLICPHCQTCQDYDVVDSRPHTGGIRRRRECSGCKGRFTTVEIVTGVHGGALRTAEALNQKAIDSDTKKQVASYLDRIKELLQCS